MENLNYISSLQNPKLKRILQLQEKSRNRKKEGVFVVEGKREINLLLQAAYNITELYYCQEFCIDSDLAEVNFKLEATFQLSKAAYQKIAYRGSTEGILAIVETKNQDLKNLVFQKKNPIILIAEAPEKPGNIGALLRTADAANIDAVIIANPKTDVYNPNIIRSSVGTVFTNQVATAKSEEVIAFLKANQFEIYTAILQDAVSYLEPNYTRKCAIVVGTEAVGLTQKWRDVATKNIKIPMQGKIDSMNVSVATGILLFEAIRQRE